MRSAQLFAPPMLRHQPNDYRRFEAAGKSILLTRDAEGRFRAFENLTGPSTRVLMFLLEAWRSGSSVQLLPAAATGFLTRPSRLRTLRRTTGPSGPGAPSPIPKGADPKVQPQR